ncbi:UROD/MetE-like protein [Fistulina hepatica ATCC 64428]|uniref:UROD/MetE-like protein n=1 Tax=Fistulina hepatica ATCC 64428 TaxID=1128425 RepID=A0A0D7AGW7_9AGAR|nr:UROD/MetE-like protein [Fistulina hepatica ATCC 64428]
MAHKLHLEDPVSRALHVGSLLRPVELYKKRQLLELDLCCAEELKAVEDEAIRHVVQLQKEAGVSIITDGELRRNMFFDGVFDKLEGMKYIPDRPISEFKSYIPHIGMMYAAGIKFSETIYCNSEIKRTKPFHIDEFIYLKSLVAEEDIPRLKVTMCSPSWYISMLIRHGSDMTYDLSVYKNDEDYFDALAVAYRQEIEELYKLGCRQIQIDEPTFCFFCNEDVVNNMKRAGVDPEYLLDQYIRAINVVTRGRPKDLVFSVHTCRGNFAGGVHFTEGPYDRIAKKLFNDLDVDVLYLEYDTERSGSLEALKYFPLNKIAVLGLVSTKQPKLETIEYLKTRIADAVDVMSMDNPDRTRAQALNHPQCGFASVWQGNPLTEEDERKKLKLLVDAAKEIWSKNAKSE